MRLHYQLLRPGHRLLPRPCRSSLRMCKPSRQGPSACETNGSGSNSPRSQHCRFAASAILTNSRSKHLSCLAWTGLSRRASPGRRLTAMACSPTVPVEIPGCLRENPDTRRGHDRGRLSVTRTPVARAGRDDAGGRSASAENPYTPPSLAHPAARHEPGSECAAMAVGELYVSSVMRRVADALAPPRGWNRACVADQTPASRHASSVTVKTRCQ